LAGARALLDLLFPPRCVVCGDPGGDLCPACLGKIRPLPAPRCAHCDTPLAAARPGAHAPGALCPACARGTNLVALDRLRMAVVYESAARAAILALKFSGQRRAAAPLARLLEPVWQASEPRASMIIPIALHPSRRQQRGYNQSELLARALGRRLGLPVRTGLLLRTRATHAQSQLPLDARYANVAGAFALAPGAKRALAGARILLLDDIITSGATIQAAASALRHAQPAAIYGLAVAHPVHGLGDLRDDGATGA
jgi:ComF family protein